MNSYNLINGNIITLDKEFPKADSITVTDGKISAINNPQKKIKTINLNKATIIPGFTDAHFHLKNYGKRLEQINLKGIKSLKKIKNIIEEKINKKNKNEWITGYGWDQNIWINKSFPKSEFLNKMKIANPIYLTRIDGHAAWVNDVAIKKTGNNIDQLKNIEGGDIINDCIIIDNSMSPFKKCLPSEDKEKVKKWIMRAINNAHKMGITGVHDAWQDKIILQSILELIKEKKFKLRCYGMLAGNDINLLNKYFKEGHYYSDYLKIRSVKAFIDGALGSRGAALHEPYCDDKNNCGLILISKKDFAKLAQQCYKNKFQLNTHAIGDKGNQYVLDQYAKVLINKNDRRWRIEHAQMVADNDVNRFKEFNILPSMQPSHCTSDMKWLDRRIGKHRLKLISRWNTFIQQGLKIPGGSDCPIETGNPLFEFYAAISRQDHQGWPKNGWQPKEKINRLNALKMFTTWAAYGGFEEHIKGKIKIGFDADITILSHDILIIPKEEILNIKILYTIINGEIVYKSK